MKYRIMFDYGAYEGFKFYVANDKENTPLEYDTVGEAVQAGMGAGYSTPFIIVQVIDWKMLIVDKT